MRALRWPTPGRFDPGLVLLLLVAVAVSWIAYDNGSYELAGRHTVALAVWWGVVVGLAFGVLRADRLPRETLAIGSLIAALSLWTFASIFWTSSAEDAFNEFDRTTLYLGVYVLVVLASSRRSLGRWADGLTVAIVFVATVALVSRLFPGSFPSRGLPTFLPSATTRLSFPLGYWNGLAIFVALGVPLVLRLALVARSGPRRSLAVAPIPVMVAAVYLTSSRGGVVTAAVGAAVFLALTERRWSASAALSVSVLGGAASIAVLLDRRELVNGPLGSDMVESQGRSAALLIALICIATACAHALGGRLLGRRLRPSRTIARGILVTGAVGVVLGIVVAHPLRRFDEFKRPPEEIDPGDFVSAHLLSGGGSGRWQFWSAAVDQWKERPLAGTGAGSYEQWWAEHAPFYFFIRNAHSLYLETFGTLGAVGLVLTVALVTAGIGVGARQALGASGETRITLAALTALFTAFGVASGFDWVWQLTAIGVTALVALALVTGPASMPAVRGLAPRSNAPRMSRAPFGLGVAVLVLAWLVICAQAVPLLAQRSVAESQAAVSRGDLDGAERDAAAARDIQPWAASPYLQMALVAEQQGELSRSRTWIEEAIERDQGNWRLWLVATRIETKLGDIPSAERSLRRAASLNPQSPLFSGLAAAQP